MKHKPNQVRGLKETICARAQRDPTFKEADVLTRYAVAARYPGLEEKVGEAEYFRALELARRVVQWAEKVIKKEVGRG